MASKRPAQSQPMPDSQALLAKHIEAALNGVSTGSVEIIVHEGKVVQIERRQRIYANDTASA